MWLRFNYYFIALFTEEFYFLAGIDHIRQPARQSYAQEYGTSIGNSIGGVFGCEDHLAFRTNSGGDDVSLILSILVHIVIARE